VAGRVEIRLSGAQADDIVPFGFELGGAGGDGERRRGLDALDASGNG
jgi:hypothetical protein